MKKKAIIGIIVAAVVIIGGVWAFAGSSNGEKTIVVQSYLTKPEVQALQPIAAKWGKEHKVDVKLEYAALNGQAALTALKSSNGPDVIYGVPNDNIGTFVKAGVLAETPKDLIPTSDFTSPKLLQAGTIDSKQYGEPIAEGTTALFYNKKLVKTPPTTMAELVKDAKTKGFQFQLSNFYYSYGFVGANGGYVFKQDANGNYDANDIGLNTPGAVKGYEFLDSLVKDKIISVSDTDSVATSNFQSGKIAYYLGGPWNVEGFKKAGLDFGVVPIPTMNGKPVPSFSTVQLALVGKNSKNQDLDWQLVKYLDEHGQDITTSVGARIPVLNSENSSKTVKDNPYIKEFEAQAKDATIMPNIPAIQTMWAPAQNNIQLMAEGKQTPKEAADKTVEQIKQGIAQQK